MTLEYLLNELCELGIRHNLVNYTAAGGSIYTLNSETIQDYPYFFFSPTEDIRIEKNFTTYGISVFYVDRLIGDNMNDTQVYSNGTLAIQNLMRQVKAMDGVVGVDDYNIRVFSETEKMADKVNGAYARVNITTLNSYNCSIYFDETGAPMGTYVPDVIKDTSVLDALASKEWVKRYFSSLEGITEDEAKELIRKALLAYTKTNKFATINGSGITNNEVYNLLETSEFNEFLSGYTQELVEIRSEISAATPSDYDEVKRQVSANTEDITEIKDSLSALTPSDYDEVKRQVSANTENIATLSSRTSENATAIEGIGTQVSANTENIATLSAFTSGLSFTINEHTEKIERLETAVSGINETISTQSSAITGINEAVSSLSAQTSANTAQISTISVQISDLSGNTEQAVSSLTQDIVALSGATSDALSGITGDLADLSGVTGDLETQIAAISTGENAAVFDMRKYGVTTQDERDIYNDMLSAYTAGKVVFLVTCIANSAGVKSSEFVVTPAQVWNDSSGNPLFHFVLLSHISGPYQIRASHAVNIYKTRTSGLVICEDLINNQRVRFFAALKLWGILQNATPYEQGCVTLGSGMTQTTYGEANVATGSGLTYDANLAVAVSLGNGLTFDSNNAVSIDNSVVTSQSVIKIWSGSLAAYQALGTYDNDTLYLIK